MEQISSEEAVEAVKRCGFKTDDDRFVVHCFKGFLGADWDVDDACRLVLEPDVRSFWAHTLFGHCLLVRRQGVRGEWIFDTVLPMGARGS